MIKKVFKVKGQTETIVDAYTKLIALNPTDKYKNKRRKDRLGARHAGGFIVLYDNQWTSVR